MSSINNMDKSKMKNFWDSINKPYQMGPHKHRLLTLDLLEAKGVESIFDNGCGTGPIYDIIFNLFPDKYHFKYKGTDYSEDMVDSCRQQFPEGNFEVQDARQLKEADNSWDCVLFMHSLDHIDKYDLAIAEAARVCKRYVCIVLWQDFRKDKGVLINNENTIGISEGEPPWNDSHLLQFSPEVLEAEFKKNNLVVEETINNNVLKSGESRYNFLYLLKKYEPV